MILRAFGVTDMEFSSQLPHCYPPTVATSIHWYSYISYYKVTVLTINIYRGKWKTILKTEKQKIYRGGVLRECCKLTLLCYPSRRRRVESCR